jgi:hypothetical protein
MFKFYNLPFNPDANIWQSTRHNFFTHAEEKNPAEILVAQCYRNITEKVNKFCKLTSTTRNLFIQAQELR